MTVILRTAALAAASFAALVVAPTPALAQQKLDAAKSEMLFVSKQMGVPVEGRFRKFDAQIAFDPKKPEAGKVAFTIDMGSATFGSPEVDVELPKATWFNVPKFPQATFQSSAIKTVGAGRFEVAGKLTIKGVSSEVVVPVSLAQTGAQTVASGSFPLKRLTFRIGDQEWADTSMVADEVQVRFRLTLTGVAKL